MRSTPRTVATRLGVALVSAVVSAGALTTAAQAGNEYQATNVSVSMNNVDTNFDWCTAPAWAIPYDGQASDGGEETNIGNDEGELTFSFDLPANINSGYITISAPQGPRPSGVPAGAPWGTQFPSGVPLYDPAAAANYGCKANSSFYLYYYGVYATFPKGDPDAGTWLYGYDNNNVDVSPAGNQVTINFGFATGDAASHLTVEIPDVTNPVEGSYTGVQYSVLVHDNNGSEYSSVAAPAGNGLTYVATSPDATTSTLTESISNGGSSIAATEDPAAGATITATIYDQYYNPIEGEPIYIGAASGSGVTEPVSFGSGNGEPTTNAEGQASYYAWGTEATPPGDPDTFFGQDTGNANFFITDPNTGNEATVSLVITAATPSPPSSGASYTSSVSVSPTSDPYVNPQTGTVTVDGTATVYVTLVDQFDNAETDNAVSLVPILSPNQSTNDFKKVSVNPGQPPNPTYGYDCNTGPASEIPGVSCTDDSGFTYFTINDDMAQTVSFEITDVTDGYTLPYTDAAPTDVPNIPVITFKPGPTSAATSTVNVDGGPSADVLADGSDPATINVTLRDDKGNPEIGHTVKIYELNGGVSVSYSATTAATDSTGSASFNVTSSQLGSAQFKVCETSPDSVCLTGANQEPTVNFITGSISASNSSVSVDPSTAVGDGQGASTVTVTVTDEGSHPLAGEPVDLDTSAYPSLATVPVAATTNSNGQVTFVVRSTSPEVVDLPVDVGTGTPVVLDSQADITFTALPKVTSVTAAPTGVTESDGFAEATGSADEDVTVTLESSTDAPIANLEVELVAGSNTSGPELTTNSSGQAVFPVGLSPTASSFTVTYAALDLSDNYREIGDVTVTYVPVPDEAHESSVQPPSQAVYNYEAGQPAGTQTAVVTVTLRDANADPIAGHVVNLDATGSAVVTAVKVDPSVTAGTTDSEGVAEFDVTDPSAEDVTLTAYDASAADLELIQSASVDFVLRPDEAEVSTITASPNLVSADGSSASTVTVTLMNNGALLDGDTVSLSEGSGHALIMTDDPVSNSAGVVTFQVRDLTAEQVALQATDLTTATLLDSDVVVTFAPPPGGTLRPSVSSVSPDSGPGTGGTVVTIDGTNLAGATEVDFGTVPAVTFAPDAAGDQIIAVSPVPLAAGAVDVTVKGPGGTSMTSTSDIFTYSTGPGVAVAAVSPEYAEVGHSSTVMITGTGLLDAHSVLFGTQSVPFSIADGGEALVATVPAAQRPGIVDVHIVSSQGTTPATSVDHFTFVGTVTPPVVAPSVRTLSPASGPLAGRNLVTLKGTGLEHATAVRFGTRRATIVSSSPAGTSLVVRVPAAEKVGTVSVTVVTASGTSAVLSTDHYRYRPRTTSHDQTVRADVTRTNEGGTR